MLYLAILTLRKWPPTTLPITQGLKPLVDAAMVLADC